VSRSGLVMTGVEKPTKLSCRDRTVAGRVHYAVLG